MAKSGTFLGMKLVCKEVFKANFVGVLDSEITTKQRCRYLKNSLSIHDKSPPSTTVGNKTNTSDAKPEKIFV